MMNILQIIFNNLPSGGKAKVKRLNKFLSSLKIIDPNEQKKRQILDLNKSNKIWEICQNPDKYWFTLNNSELSESRFVTIKLIVDNPNYTWDWPLLSANMFLPIAHILKYPDLPWNYNILSDRKDLTWDLFYKNIDKPWSRKIHNHISLPVIWDMAIIKKIPDYFDYVENISWEFIKHFNLIDGYCGDFVAHKSVTWQHMLEYPEWDWGIYSIENKKDIPFKYIYIIRYLQNLKPDDSEITFKEVLEFGETYNPTLNDLLIGDKTNILRYSFVRHLQIPVKFILKHKELAWDWSYFFYRQDLTENDLYEVQDKWHLNLGMISKHKQIPYKFYVDNANYNWDWYYIYENKKIDWQIANAKCRIEKHAPAWVLSKFIDNLVDYNGMLLNPNLTEELFITIVNKGRPWIHDINISRSPFLTWDIISKYKHLPWNFGELINNFNIHPDIIAENYILFLSFMRKK